MWFEQEVERACGGWVDWLVRAIQTHDGLTLRKTPLGSGSTPEWAVHLEPAFHHLILPKPHVDAWATLPDTDEVEDPGDPFDDDDYPSWTERDGGALARSAGVAVDEETVGGEWAAADVAARQDVGWGAPDSGGWGKVADFDEAGSRGWGAPEGEWTWGEQ
ncbi:hypothetical protein C8T65DRAFT_738762 [Cerioporus squamosus]|nr:hypothetical protein C8T65DRAFT_738762 [Cerioporus squamosus]